MNPIDSMNAMTYQSWQNKRGAKNAKASAMQLRSQIYMSYLQMVKELLSTKYVWDDLPDYIDEGFVEMNLPFTGTLGAFRTTVDINGEEVTLSGIQRGTYTGTLNAYDKMDQYTITSNNALLNKTYRIDDSPEQMAISNDKGETADKFVLIKNNAYGTAVSNQIDFQIKKLVEVDMAWMVNVKRMSMPIVMVGTKEGKAQMIAGYNEVAATVPFIMLDEKAVSALQTSNLFQRDVNDNGYLDLLQEQRKTIWNDLLEILGIMTVNNSKKERLVVDEANSQRETVDAYTFTGLRMRQIAVERINEKGIFDKEISVKLNDEVDYGRTIERFQERNAEIIGRNFPNNLDSLR